MKKFLFAFLLLVMSTSLPLALTMNSKPEALITENPSPNQEIAEKEPEQLVTMAEEKPNKTPLTDLEGHWAKTYINQLYNDDILSGYEDGHFGPDQKITRAEVVKIALLAFHHEVGTDASVNAFTDISETDWFYDYVMNAMNSGIASGYTDKTFHPNSEVTRAEALKIILTAGGVTEFDSVIPNFTDVNTIGDWFAKYTAYAKLSGIISGYSDGTFHGNQSITRAEVSKIVVELMQSLK